jgi:O-antigen/teichoic acid export membrane protein
MAQESRVKKTLLNARVNLIFYFLTLALSFFSRKIFLDCLGADFLGLTGSLGSLLGFLNLAELGIGSAIGYVLYKPLFEQNQEKINEIISVFGYLYRWVGLFILVGGLILAGFFPLIYPDTGFDYGIIYFAYFSFLFSSLIGYFVNYRQTLLGADQRNYVVTAYFQTAGLIKTLIQMALAYYTGNYYLWVIVEFVFGILYAVILNWKINQVYPWLKTDVRNGKELRKKYPEIIKYTKQLFVHKIGEVAQSQVTTFLIYAFGSLQSIAFYGNYTMVTTKLSGLIGNFLGSTTASIGNLIAEGDSDRVYKIYWELTAVNFFIAGICAISLYFLLPSFITLWLGSQYVMSDAVLILVILSFCLSLIRSTTSQFKYGYGLFSDVWSPVAESLILILVAIIGGKLWGLEGVLLGGIISVLIVIYGWQAYFLFSRGFKKSVWLYIYGYVKNLVVMFCCFYLTYKLMLWLSIDLSPKSWQSWILFASEIVVFQCVISLVIMSIFIPGMRFFIKRLLKI